MAARAEEHRAVLAEIVGIAGDHRVDITLVAGDLFDISSPSPEDSRSSTGRCSTADGPVLVGGNHDSGTSRGRETTPRPGRITVVARLPGRPTGGGRVRLTWSQGCPSRSCRRGAS